MKTKKFLILLGTVVISYLLLVKLVEESDVEVKKETKETFEAKQEKESLPDSATYETQKTNKDID